MGDGMGTVIPCAVFGTVAVGSLVVYPVLGVLWVGNKVIGGAVKVAGGAVETVVQGATKMCLPNKKKN